MLVLTFSTFTNHHEDNLAGAEKHPHPFLSHQPQGRLLIKLKHHEQLRLDYKDNKPSSCPNLELVRNFKPTWNLNCRTKSTELGLFTWTVELGSFFSSNQV